MAVYQLSIPSGTGPTHIPFVYFNNGLGGSDHFSIVVTHNRLSRSAAQKWCERIVAYHGSEDKLGRRSTGSMAPGFIDGDYSDVTLEFMKYVIVWSGSGDSPAACVCMDTLCDVEWSGSEAALLRCAGVGLRPVDLDVGLQGGMRSVLPGSTETSDRRRTLRFVTPTHATVSVTVSTFRDPDTRNGVQVSIGGTVTRENAWGALVRAVHPKKLMERKFTRRPRIFPTGFDSCAGVNEDEYFKQTVCTAVGSTEEHTLMIPRGGPGKAYRLNVSSSDT